MSKLCIISLFAVSSVLLFADSIRSATPPANPPLDSNPYILQEFDREEVVKLKNGSKVYNNCWEKPNSYKVCLKRTYSLEYFDWNNEKIPFKVTTKKYRSGNRTQTWLFENAKIYLCRRPRGKIIQTWKLPNTTWEYTKWSNGEVDEKWKGEKDEDALQHYKSVIDSWCAENNFYMGKEHCVIY